MLAVHNASLSMPMESNYQKQCLLPVVLAVFELRCPGNGGDVAAATVDLEYLNIGSKVEMGIGTK